MVQTPAGDALVRVALATMIAMALLARGGK
jgi:hypothetical protein